MTHWLLLSFLAVAPLPAQELKIAVLHPLLADLARNVAGEHADVVELIGPNEDPHHFEPRPENLKRAGGATIYLVAGMGLEGYLPVLKGIVADHAKVIEIGASLPPLTGAAGGHAAADPHWWHSIELYRRATNVVADVLIAADPDDADSFRQNAARYRQELDELEQWVRREISKVPRDHRELATTHAAFGYFCRDYGFEALPVEGLNHEQTPAPKELAAVIEKLKSKHVAAIFPERESNPKIMEMVTADTGIKLADPLIADGTGGLSYVAMYRHNVEAIVKALAH